MNQYARNGFVHSVKVPRLYKTASVIAKKVVEEGGSLKDLVYSSGHKNIKGVYALVVETIKHSKEIDKIFKSSKLLQNETRLQPWLARILVTELLFGKKELKGDSKPVKTVLGYQKKFEKILANRKSNDTSSKRPAKKPRYVRVNTLLHTPDEIIKIFRNEGWVFLPPASDYSDFLQAISQLNENHFIRDFHIKELLVFPGNTQFYENELYQNRSILLQDKASCLPAFLLQPSSNSVVLDMCAAPGMKTTHLSALMRNKGKIYATELEPKRYNILCDVVKSAECTNVYPLNIDALKLNQEEIPETDTSWCNEVEYILVDPSCSGSGIVERVNIFSDNANESRRLKKLCGFQFKLLKHALTNFPNVKRVVYSTCSIHPEENEQVVEDVLKSLNDTHVKFKLGEPLKDTWARRGSKKFEIGKSCIFADPKKDLTNGFFIAVFEKIETENTDGVKDVTEESEKKKKRKNKNLEVENAADIEEVNEENEEKEDEDENRKKHKKKKKKKKRENSP